jgi:hypothetical protein
MIEFKYTEPEGDTITFTITEGINYPGLLERFEQFALGVGYHWNTVKGEDE